MKNFPRKHRPISDERLRRLNERDHYLHERCQTHRGWNHRPYNRLCPSCRLTFPGNCPPRFKDQGELKPGQGRYTSVCPNCGGTLKTVSSTLRVPRRHQRQAWARLAACGFKTGL